MICFSTTTRDSTVLLTLIDYVDALSMTLGIVQ